MEIENQHNFEHALHTGINVFLGAGFSILARDREDNPLPLASQLTGELVSRFKLFSLSDLPLAQLCTVIEHTRPDELRSYFNARFTVKSYDTRYGALDRLNIKSIFTTNI